MVNHCRIRIAACVTALIDKGADFGKNSSYDFYYVRLWSTVRRFRGPSRVTHRPTFLDDAGRLVAGPFPTEAKHWPDIGFPPGRRAGARRASLQRGHRQLAGKIDVGRGKRIESARGKTGHREIRRSRIFAPRDRAVHGDELAGAETAAVGNQDFQRTREHPSMTEIEQMPSLPRPTCGSCGGALKVLFVSLPYQHLARTG